MFTLSAWLQYKLQVWFVYAEERKMPERASAMGIKQRRRRTYLGTSSQLLVSYFVTSISSTLFHIQRRLFLTYFFCIQKIYLLSALTLSVCGSFFFLFHRTRGYNLSILPDPGTESGKLDLNNISNNFINNSCCCSQVYCHINDISAVAHSSLLQMI